jgi:predicted porin
MKQLMGLGLAAVLGAAALSAQAQSSVNLYGVIDQYLNYMHSSSGARIRALEDGAWLRSRIGVRGQEDLGDGFFAKFLLEGGFNTDTGAVADGNGRFFDRQSWVGLGSATIGEFRIGRQNGPIQSHGGYVDFTARDLGSMINNFGVPSRYDNDFSYLSPRLYGVAAEAHVALPEAPVGNRPLIYQGWVDWTNDVFRAGYMGIRGRPPRNALINQDMVYDNVYADWMYGKGTVYLAYVRSNNSTSSGSAAAGTLINNGGAIIGNAGGNATALNAGGYNTGTNPNLNNFYRIWQVSADYKVTPQLRIGALWGQIQDKSGRDQGAKGGAIGAYYDLSKRTMLLALVDTLRNDTNGGWRPQGSAGLKTTFTTSNDVNGRTINGAQLGIVHRF